MRVPFYRRIASPLHATRAGVGMVWALALTSATLLIEEPLILLALLGALLAAGRGAGVGLQLLRALRAATTVAVAIVIVNVVVSREGLTVFARLGSLGPFGQGNLTVEALVYGAVIALKVTLLILISSLASLAVDPDEVLRIWRRLSFRSALSASLASRMVPLLAADAQRMGEAQRTRPGGAPRRGRARMALFTAVMASSLDRALDVAATLELRGFASARRAPRLVARPLSRHDIGFGCSAAGVLALALLARVARASSFSAYPLIRMPLSPDVLLLALALVTLVLLPFASRRGIEP